MKARKRKPRRILLGTGFRSASQIDVVGVEGLVGGAIKHAVTLYERCDWTIEPNDLQYRCTLTKGHGRDHVSGMVSWTDPPNTNESVIVEHAQPEPPAQPAPGHTDLMVTPESLVAAEPKPASPQFIAREVEARDKARDEAVRREECNAKAALERVRELWPHVDDHALGLRQCPRCQIEEAIAR